MKPYTDTPDKLCYARNCYRLLMANTRPAKKAARRLAKKQFNDELSKNPQHTLN